MHGLCEIGAIDIGDETAGQIAVAIVLQCLVGHVWTEVGTADTNVDNIANALASIAFPFAAAHSIRESRHFIKHGMHIGYYILAVNDDDLGFGSTEGNMKDGAVLGN